MSSITVDAGIACSGLAAAGAFVWQQDRAAHGPGGASLAPSAAIGATAWLVVTQAAALSGALADFAARPPPFLLLVVAACGLALGLGLSRLGARSARELSFAALIAPQALRLPLELLMHHAAAEGIMPPQLGFTGEGVNFDVATGGAALLVAALLASGLAGRRLAAAWTVMSWVTLGVVIAVSLASTPPIHAFGADPVHLNTWVAFPPNVWLVAGPVTFALFTQVVLTRKLFAERRERRAEPALPPGQRALGRAPPRFGLEAFLSRPVAVAADWRLVIDGDVETPLALGLDEIIGDRRAEATHDLHCVTTWTATGLAWSGRGFRDLWESVIVPQARPRPGVAYVLATAFDGYEAAVPLEEALDDRCLLADRLHGAPLPLDHGAPLRLVVPRLYAYKSVKHLVRLTLRVSAPSVKISRFLAHPRGRVDLEERSGVGLQRFWRVLYRLLRPLFLRQARRHQLGR